MGYLPPRPDVSDLDKSYLSSARTVIKTVITDKAHTLLENLAHGRHSRGIAGLSKRAKMYKMYKRLGKNRTI